jgi:periplasmic divalent cation tolerance protein
MEQARIVLTTVSSLEEAERIADSLVEQRLAACVNLLPGIKSVYRWQNAIEKAAEILLVIKTSAEKLPALETAVHELHPYDVPEFVTINIESGSAGYLRWLFESLA